MVDMGRAQALGLDGGGVHLLSGHIWAAMDLPLLVPSSSLGQSSAVWLLSGLGGPQKADRRRVGAKPAQGEMVLKWALAAGYSLYGFVQLSLGHHARVQLAGRPKLFYSALLSLSYSRDNDRCWRFKLLDQPDGMIEKGSFRET